MIVRTGLEEMVAKLTDLETALELFRDDVIFHAAASDMKFKSNSRTKEGPQWAALTSYALRTTMAIVEKIEEFAQRTGKTVLYVLSYWDFTCKRYLETGQRFDQELVDWFKDKGLPCVDLLECHRQEYEEDFKCSVDKYTARYWNSHYAPNGNAFCAWAVLPSLLEQLRAAGKPAACENLHEG